MPHPKTQWARKFCHHPAHDAEPPPAHKNGQEKKHPRQARPRRSRRNLPPSRPHGRMIRSSRSEERRVGKECKSRRVQDVVKKKKVENEGGHPLVVVEL